jgi:hypothetical protein
MSTAIILVMNIVLAGGVFLAVNGLLVWAVMTQDRDHAHARRTRNRRPEWADRRGGLTEVSPAGSAYWPVRGF